MHPNQKVIALKGEFGDDHYRHQCRVSAQNEIHKTSLAGRQLQTFNLATKQKLSSHLCDEDVTFWKWINDTQIGLVMDRSVAHWDAMGGQTAPKKVH